MNWNPVLTVIATMAFGATGPLASWLLTKGVPADQIGPLMTWFQTSLAAITPVLATAFLGWLATVKQRLAGIKAMPAAAVTAAIASMPVEAKADIKVAAMPDQTLIAAVAAMPGVTRITVADAATDGVAIAAKDKTLTKVMTETDAKAA